MSKKLCGIDEAGRGCLAGPLVVAGCVLHEKIDGLKDSKVLSEKQREKLYAQITKTAKYKIVQFSHSDIDNFGLSKCLGDSIKIIKKHFFDCDILMDGNCTFGNHGIMTMIKADAKIEEVSAASILAKVTRDNYMKSISKIYPNYQYEKHKGYGSKLHIELIRKFGVSPIQRVSFKIKALEQILEN